MYTRPLQLNSFDDLDKILVKGWSNFGAHKLRRIGVTLELECMWEKVRFRLLAEEKSKAFLCQKMQNKWSQKRK